MSGQGPWGRELVAPATINTANQLFAFVTEEPTVAAEVDQILLLPDYFTFLLSGCAGMVAVARVVDRV